MAEQEQRKQWVVLGMPSPADNVQAIGPIPDEQVARCVRRDLWERGWIGLYCAEVDVELTRLEIGRFVPDDSR